MTITTIVWLLLASFVASSLAAYLKLPTVVGQIVAGIVIGPALLGVVKPSGSLNLWSEIGVIILMFLAGLESDLTMLKKYFKPALVVAGAGVAVPVVIFMAVGQLLGYTPPYTWFLAVLFSATSVSITAQVLAEYQQLDSVAGVTIMGAAVVDDLLAVALWLAYSAVFQVGGAVQHPIWQTLIIILGAVVGLLLFVRWGLPVMLNWLTKLSQKLYPIGLLIIILGLGQVTELAGLSAVITALILGVALANSRQQAMLLSQIAPIGQHLFIPIFFVGIGVKITLTGQMTQLVVILLLTGAAIVSKWLGAGLGAYVMGLNRHQSAIVATGMVSRGEMALVIADLGLTVGVVDHQQYATLAIVIVLATLFTPLTLKGQLREKQSKALIF